MVRSTHKKRTLVGRIAGTLLLGFVVAGSGGAQQLTKTAPTAAELSAQAEQALRQQNFPAATQAYRAMIAADPANSEAWTGLGVLLYGSGDASQAADALKQALTLNPEAPRAKLFLAFSQADLRQCAAALPVLEHSFATEPTGKLQRLTGLTLLGCTAGTKEDLLAVQTAARLKQTYPGDADVLYQAAQLYTRLWSESADELMTAHPDSYRVHQLAAEVNEAQGNSEQAIRQYRAALAENARLPQMHFRIGQLLLKTGAPDADLKAMDEFRAELAVNPQSAPAALAMAEIDRHEGHLEEAAASYRLASRLDTEMTEARVGLAQTFLAQHQAAASETELAGVLATHPENAQAHYAMMLTYRAQGKLPQAAREMDAFKRLQQGGADQFRDKLNALLGGTSSAPKGQSGPDATTPGPERVP